MGKLKDLLHLGHHHRPADSVDEIPSGDKSRSTSVQALNQAGDVVTLDAMTGDRSGRNSISTGISIAIDINPNQPLT